MSELQDFEKNVKKVIKDLGTECIGIYCNQISTYMNALESTYKYLEDVHRISTNKNKSVLFDFKTRGNRLIMKKEQAAIVYQYLLTELDDRIKKDFDLVLDYEYIQGVSEDLSELKKNLL